MKVVKPRVRRELVGVVASDKMTKTIVVKVDNKVKHPLYRKFVTRSNKYKVHDEKNDARVGDLVRICESRPLSREKNWALVEIIRKSGQKGRELNRA